MYGSILQFIKRIWKYILSFAMVLVILILPLTAQAQTQCQIFNPNTPNFGPNCIPLFRDFQGSREGIGGVLVKVADYAIFILGSLGVLMLVYAGFLFVTDGGSGERAGRGRKIIFNVIIGIVLALASYTIVTFVSGFVSSLDISNLNGSTTNTTIQ